MIVKTVSTPAFCYSSRCYVHFSTVWMFMLTVSVWRGHVHQVLSVSDPSSRGVCSLCFLSLQNGCAGVVFSMSANQLSTFPSSLACIFTLHPKWCILCMLDLSSFLFPTLHPELVILSSPGCISLMASSRPLTKCL